MGWVLRTSRVPLFLSVLILILFQWLSCQSRIFITLSCCASPVLSRIRGSEQCPSIGLQRTWQGKTVTPQFSLCNRCERYLLNSCVSHVLFCCCWDDLVQIMYRFLSLLNRSQHDSRVEGGRAVRKCLDEGGEHPIYTGNFGKVPPELFSNILKFLSSEVLWYSE